MLAQDLTDLQQMVVNRQEAMAAELITTGKITVRGFADDGITVAEDVIEFDTASVREKTWSNANADIYGDLKEASENIQEFADIIPTLLICGKNIESYLVKNTFLKQFLFTSNPTAMAWLNLQPKYTSPQVRTLGFISALNVTLISYLKTYTDDVTGEVKKFIPDDTAILCVPGNGKQLYGSISLLEENSSSTYAAPLVPFYSADETAQVSLLTLYSRPLVVSEDAYDWIAFKVS